MSFSANLFEFIQTAGVIGGFLFTAYQVHKDSQARKVSNLIALSEQYGRIWQELHSRPTLARVLSVNVDLDEETISDQEHLFVKMLIFHLDTVRRTANAGMFVKIEGLQKDVRQFFSHPIPNAIWEKLKPFQDQDFVRFVEEHREQPTVP